MHVCRRQNDEITFRQPLTYTKPGFQRVSCNLVTVRLYSANIDVGNGNVFCPRFPLHFGEKSRNKVRSYLPIPVLHHVCQVRLPGQEARRVRARHRRPPRHEEGRERPHRRQQQAQDHRHHRAVRTNVKQKMVLFPLFCGDFKCALFVPAL